MAPSVWLPQQGDDSHSEHGFRTRTIFLKYMAAKPTTKSASPCGCSPSLIISWGLRSIESVSKASFADNIVSKPERTCIDSTWKKLGMNVSISILIANEQLQNIYFINALVSFSLMSIVCCDCDGLEQALLRAGGGDDDSYSADARATTASKTSLLLISCASRSPPSADPPSSASCSSASMEISCDLLLPRWARRAPANMRCHEEGTVVDEETGRGRYHQSINCQYGVANASNMSAFLSRHSTNLPSRSGLFSKNPSTAAASNIWRTMDRNRAKSAALCRLAISGVLLSMRCWISFFSGSLTRISKSSVLLSKILSDVHAM